MFFIFVSTSTKAHFCSTQRPYYPSPQPLFSQSLLFNWDVDRERPGERPWDRNFFLSAYLAKRSQINHQFILSYHFNFSPWLISRHRHIKLMVLYLSASVCYDLIVSGQNVAGVNCCSCQVTREERCWWRVTCKISLNEINAWRACSFWKPFNSLI